MLVSQLYILFTSREDIRCHQVPPVTGSSTASNGDAGTAGGGALDDGETGEGCMDMD